MRIWPAQKILNENYDIYGKNTEDGRNIIILINIIIETFFDWSTQIFQVVNQNNTKNVVADFPFCILNGPYLDVKTYLTPTISMNSLLIMNNGFKGKFLFGLLIKLIKGIIQAELKLLIFQDIIEGTYYLSLFLNNFILFLLEMKFMKTGFLLSFNLVGRFINYPIYWIELNDKNQNLLIYNYTYRTGVYLHLEI